jgi:hypothetical protein
LSDFDADLIVVGSGPAGAQAAKKAVDLGLRVLNIDVGVSDRSLADSIPRRSFTELRRGDEQQSRYFIGELSESGMGEIAGGAHVTPPRAYMFRHVAELTPVISETFRPVLSLAMGGLGVGWGAGCETFTRAESDLAGLDYDQIHSLYREVAADIGISGSRTDDTSDNMADIDNLQPPLTLDDNSAAVMATYERRREEFKRLGFRLGRPPLAILSEPLAGDDGAREANPLQDMDMYSDASRSVYRPWITIEALRNAPGYRYAPGLLAREFREIGDGVEVFCRDLKTGAEVRFSAARLVLAAGALNTSRIALRSLRAYGRRRPLICNRYRYVPAVNLATLGRPVRDDRHSQAQLVGTLSALEHDPDQIFVGLYSYRSLLLYRLVAEMPFPPQLGLLAARILLSSLTVLGVHFSDRAASSKWLELSPGGSTGEDTLRAEYAATDAEDSQLDRGMRSIAGVMRTLRLLPLRTVDPGNGSSIHYAGPLGISKDPHELATAPEGNLYAAQRVYIADSACWNFLPGKGPTVTIMAHARNVVAAAARSLGKSAQRSSDAG